MSFSVYNTNTSASALTNTAKEPIFNAAELQSIRLGDFSDIGNGDVLVFDGTEWTFSSIVDITGPTGPGGGDFINKYLNTSV